MRFVPATSGKNLRPELMSCLSVEVAIVVIAVTPVAVKAAVIADLVVDTVGTGFAQSSPCIEVAVIALQRRHCSDFEIAPELDSQ